ncbi:MAG: sulfatase-like hydrolase/transferase [Planctomycetes bacterium]|nr:sulfatase-like hydrolase/transferase [Planctomycetota bacterium]
MKGPVLALLAAAAALWACGPHPSAARGSRGVLVLAVDALRADHVSGLGYDRATTPALDRLAEEGATFLDAWSAAPEVLPAHAALLTGCDPGLAQRPGAAAPGPAADLARWRVPDGFPSLAQELLARGFETAAFVDHPDVAPIRGVAKGFQTFAGYREDAVDPDLELGFEGVATRFVRWLASRAADADWFAYLHVNDLERVWTRPPLDPRWDALYEPRPELGSMPPVAEGDHAFFAIPRPRWAGVPKTLGEYELRYDGAIGQLDTKLARLLERLRRLGRLDNTTVVVVGAFGVSFGEGGLYLDTGALTAADLRVPLVVRPGAGVALPRGSRLDGLASLVDVAPTVLELLGLRPPPSMSGVSHAPRLRDPALPAARERAHAWGGFQRGVAAIDADWILARDRPAEAKSALLVRTYFGSGAPPDAGVVERLARRGAQVAVDPGPGAADAARARLGAALDDWTAWIDRARGVLHGRVTPAADPATTAELRRRGLLSPAR